MNQKKIKALVVALVTCFSVFGLAACNQNAQLKNDQYFTADVGKWSQCPIADQQNRECQYVPVPLYKGSTQNINIAVAKIPARKSNEKKGTLVLAAGGPNASGLSMAAGATAFLAPEILDHYDIVSYDRRGVGRSGQMDCDDQPDILDMIDQFANIGEIQNYTGIAEGISDYVQKCAAKTNQIFAQGGSKLDAQDVDHVRETLGEDKIGILSYSYGTLMAQSYLAQFGQHAQKVIMDSAFDPNVSGAQYVTKNDPALGFPPKFNDGVQGPQLSQAQSQAANGLREADKILPVNQAYVCKDFKWDQELTKLAQSLQAQDPAQRGQAMDPLKAYAVCSMLQHPDYVLGELKPAQGSPKALVVNSTEDARAKLDGAKAVATRMNAYLFEVPGDRHMISGFGRQCAMDAVKRYLLNDTFDENIKCNV